MIGRWADRSKYTFCRKINGRGTAASYYAGPNFSFQNLPFLVRINLWHDRRDPRVTAIVSGVRRPWRFTQLALLLATWGRWKQSPLVHSLALP
jgi:hypothetical protein